MTPAPTPSPVDGGAAGDWIEWSGGECPVAPDAKVGVRFRDGWTSYAGRAGFWSTWWQHVGHSFDITAYRVVQP